MYSISSFRDNLREAFNKAERGESVIIERYDRTFELMVYPEVTDPKLKKLLNDMPKIGFVDDPTYTDPEDAA